VEIKLTPSSNCRSAGLRDGGHPRMAVPDEAEDWQRQRDQHEMASDMKSYLSPVVLGGSGISLISEFVYRYLTAPAAARYRTARHLRP